MSNPARQIVLLRHGGKLEVHARLVKRFRAARCRAKTREDAAEPAPELVVGIDLGTTNSVIAVGHTQVWLT